MNINTGISQKLFVVAYHGVLIHRSHILLSKSSKLKWLILFVVVVGLASSATAQCGAQPYKMTSSASSIMHQDPVVSSSGIVYLGFKSLGGGQYDYWVYYRASPGAAEQTIDYTTPGSGYDRLMYPYISNGVIVWAKEPEGAHLRDIFYCVLPGCTKRRVTNNGEILEYDPVTNGDVIAWYQEEPDLQATFIAMCRISLNGGAGGCDQGVGVALTPDDDLWEGGLEIYGSTLIWHEEDVYGSDEYDVVRYNLPSGPKTSVTDDNIEQWGAEIYGDRIVWYDQNRDIIMADFGAGTEETIASHATNNYLRPDIYGNIIVWDSAGSAAPGIYWHDTSQAPTFRLTTDSDDNNPSIWGDIIAYQNYVGSGNMDIWVYDTGCAPPITTTSTTSTSTTSTSTTSTSTTSTSTTSTTSTTTTITSGTTACESGDRHIKLTNDAWRTTTPHYNPAGDRIIYSDYDGGATGKIWSMDLIGQNRVQLYDSSIRNPSSDDPTGKIVFIRGNQIWTMNSDGSGATQISSHTGLAEAPHFSPDGTEIVYAHYDEPNGIFYEIWIMNSDGSNPHSFLDSDYIDPQEPPTWNFDVHHASFNSDGTKILFDMQLREHIPRINPTTILFTGNIWSINYPSKTSLTQITFGSAWYKSYPHYNSDDTEVTYATIEGNYDLWVINSDGSNKRNLGETGGAWWPVFSRDDCTIAYSSSNYVKVLDCCGTMTTSTSTTTTSTTTSTTTTSTTSTTTTSTTTSTIIDSSMVTYQWDANRPPGSPNVNPTGAIPVTNPDPVAGGYWELMTCPGGVGASGLNAECTFPWNKCDQLFGACPGCAPDYEVDGTTGIYGDLDNDGISDVPGWVQATDSIYSCLNAAELCPNSQTPDDNDFCYNMNWYNWGVCVDASVAAQPIDPDNPPPYVNECHATGGDEYCEIVAGSGFECWCLPLVNLSLDIGVDSALPWEWYNTSYFFAGPESVWSAPDPVINKINSILDSNCGCMGCIIDGNNCFIPFEFTSNPLNESVEYLVEGNITVDSISFDYTFARIVDRVGYAGSFRYAEGALWDISYNTFPTGFATVSAYPIPPDCTACNALNYIPGDYNPPALNDAIDDAVWRLLNKSDDVSDVYDGRIGPWDVDSDTVYFNPDPMRMWFSTDETIQVQSLWGPVTVKLIVWT